MPSQGNAADSPRWMIITAWGAFLATVPSALWRVLMIVGLMPGTAGLRAYELGTNPTFAYSYVFALSIVQLVTGLVTLGLIKPWGERLKGWRIPTLPVVLVAAAGGLAVVYLFNISMVSALVQGRRPDAGLVHGPALGVMLACYAPILFWGPLELVTTIGYWHRRRRTRT